MAEDKKIENIDEKIGNMDQAPMEKLSGSRQEIPVKKIETTQEKSLEKVIEKMPVTETKEGEAGVGASFPASTTLPNTKEREEKIEKILADGLEETYVNLPEQKRREFKLMGEATSRKISDLVGRGKATARKIVELIKKWLMLIPGVNQFFLEQEAKIKTDRILKECRGQKPEEL